MSAEVDLDEMELDEGEIILEWIRSPVSFICDYIHVCVFLHCMFVNSKIYNTLPQ